MNLIVKFNYFYKDFYGNRKYGTKLFSNPFHLSLESIDQCLKERLIFEKYFYPEQVNILKFKFHRFDCNYHLYEYDSIEFFKVEMSEVDDYMENLDASINGFLLSLVHMFY